jgi:hypothetical protein
MFRRRVYGRVFERFAGDRLRMPSGGQDGP